MQSPKIWPLFDFASILLITQHSFTGPLTLLLYAGAARATVFLPMTGMCSLANVRCMIMIHPTWTFRRFRFISIAEAMYHFILHCTVTLFVLLSLSRIVPMTPSSVDKRSSAHQPPRFHFFPHISIIISLSPIFERLLLAETLCRSMATMFVPRYSSITGPSCFFSLLCGVVSPL